MTALAQTDFLADHAFLLGDAVDLSSLSEAARRRLETRLMAAVFKRRWPLIMHWRTQSMARAQALQRLKARTAPCVPGRPLRVAADREITVISDLPAMLTIAHEEIALLRAFLSHEMNTILFDEAS